MTTLSSPHRTRQPKTPPDTGPQDTSPQNGDASRSSQEESRRTQAAAAFPAAPILARQQTSLQNTSASGSLPARKKRAPYYPTGDGKPMAEDVLHRKLMAHCCDALEQHFAARPDVLVAGNDFVYYEEGNPKARVSPDCYVCLGVPPRGIRHFYKIWEENDIAPAVVIELTSKKTQREDVRVKRPLYEQVLRVQEYFQFDPTGDYLRPRLQGQRLTNGVYQPIELRDDRMTSEQLGLELVVEGETLRLYDPARSEFLRTYAQAETQRVAEQQRAEQEARRAEQETQRAEQEAQRAEQEAQRAEQEARRAETAEAELSRLRQELDALRRQQ